VRIGLIGAGWVTQHHLKAWARLEPRARVVAIADPARERAQERAARFGIAAVHASAEAMLEHERLDAVDIAAPREQHAPLVRLAAERGLAVLCQKPLAPTLAEAQALVADVGVRTRLMVHENWRFRPWYRRIAQWLSQGRIGAVKQVHMSLYSSGLLRDAEGRYPLIERQPFVATLERALVAEILIHQLDALRFLLGELTLRQARLGRTCLAMRGDDHASLWLDTAAGASVQLGANLCTHGEPPGLVDRLLLIGEHGTIKLDGELLRCEGRSPAQERFDLAAGYQASYDAVIEHFVQALAEGTPFDTAPSDNLRTLALVERAYEPAKP
jgi:predicted dehydrogenase